VLLNVTVTSGPPPESAPIAVKSLREPWPGIIGCVVDGVSLASRLRSSSLVEAFFLLGFLELKRLLKITYLNTPIT
jgi:hypothetical protein